MRYVIFWALAVFLAGCPTRPRFHGSDGGSGGGGDGDADAGSPSIAIVSPASMTYANGDVAIEVQVAGGTATTIELLRNDTPWQQVSGPPFQFTWDTTSSADGDYVLTATATVDGQLVTSAPVTVSVDHTPPEVTDVTPARGSLSVDLTEPIKVTFSEPVVPSTVSDASVQLSVGGTAVASTVALAADAKSLTVTITDRRALTLPADFTGTVATTITDRAGNPLAPLGPAWTWTVPAWIQLPPLPTQMPPRLAVGADRRPVILYVTLDNVAGNNAYNVRVAPFENGAWNTAMGAPTTTADTARNGYSLALDSKGQPVVAWTQQGAGQFDVHVGAWTGTAWNAQFQALSAVSDASSDATLPSVQVDPSDKAVVAWREVTAGSGTMDIFVSRWNGTSWTQLSGSGVMGGAGFAQLQDGPKLVVDTQGNPIFGWVSIGIGTGVSFWSGTGWTRSAALIGGFTPYPVLDATGTPWIAAKSTDLHVLKWNSSMLNWPEATSTLTTSSSWNAPRLAFAPDGSPVVAWVDTSSGVRIGVARWTGSWDTRFGEFNAGQNPLNNIVPELVVDGRGSVWVAWMEGTAVQVWMSNY